MGLASAYKLLMAPAGPRVRVLVLEKEADPNRYHVGESLLPYCYYTLERIGAVDAVREASEGETRLFIQTIDFLSIRRRPEKEKFLRRFLALTDAHRGALGARGNPAAEGSEDRMLVRVLFFF